MHVPHAISHRTNKKHMKCKIMVPVTSLIRDTVQLLEAGKGEVVWKMIRKKCLLKEWIFISVLSSAITRGVNFTSFTVHPCVLELIFRTRTEYSQPFNVTIKDADMLRLALWKTLDVIKISKVSRAQELWQGVKVHVYIFTCVRIGLGRRPVV